MVLSPSARAVIKIWDWVPKTFEQSKKYLLVFTTGMIILTAAINLFAPANPAYNCEGYTPAEKTAKGTQVWNSVSAIPLGAGAALLMYAAINKIQWWSFAQLDTTSAAPTGGWWAPKVFGYPIKLVNTNRNMLYIFAATLVLVVMTATSLGAHNEEENSRCKHPTHGWNKFAFAVACMSFVGFLALLWKTLSVD